MLNTSQYGDTILLQDLQTPASAKKLTRVQFSKGDAGVAYDEAWLQKLIMMHPGVLPIGQLERAFVDMVPICMELPLSVGFADNLFMTPRGDIALIECKLWRNPQAKREVVAQIVEYASELATWSYEKLEKAVQSVRSRGSEEARSQSLFEIVAAAGEVNEAAFHDDVSKNLRLGRIFLLIVGDGVREGLKR